MLMGEHIKEKEIILLKKKHHREEKVQKCQYDEPHHLFIFTSYLILLELEKVDF